MVCESHTTEQYIVFDPWKDREKEREKVKEFDWSRYPEEAEAAWCEFNYSGNREPVYDVILDAAKKAGDPGKLFRVMLFALTVAYPKKQ